MKNKNNRIVVKVGTSTLTYDTGKINLRQMHNLARVLSDLRNRGYEVILVSSGAIGVAMGKLGISKKPTDTKVKQSLAAVGQCELMALYDHMFSEYQNIVAQILLTRSDVDREKRKQHMRNTFDTLLEMGIIPIVNENDTVSTHEIQFGDNDRLSAIVAALIGADLLILLSDIDGLYSDDPRSNPDARFISFVKAIAPDLMEMGKDSTGSDVGTGGMAAKLAAARIATDSGSDMVITNGEDVEAIEEIISGAAIGTLFLAHTNLDFDLIDYVNNRY